MFSITMRRLLEGDVYKRAAFKRRSTVSKVSHKIDKYVSFYAIATKALLDKLVAMATWKGLY